MTHPLPDRLQPHGINFDLSATSLPPDKFSGGRNVYFRAGETFRTPGYAPFAETGRLFPAKYLHYVDFGSAAYWIYVSEAGIGATDGVTHWNLTPTSWGPIVDIRQKFTLGDINTIPFVNHPTRGPFWWDGDVSHKFVTLPGWPAGWTCWAMRPHKNFLMALGIDSGAGNLEMQVSWSASAAPGTVPAEWTPSPTNDAGDISFPSVPGPIMDGITVRDQFFIMKETYTAAMQYVGGQYIFMSRDVFPETGILTTGACVQKSGRVMMVTSELQVVIHDGNQLENISLGVFEDYFRRTINQQYHHNAFMHRNDQQNQVYVDYPTTGAYCSEAISIEMGTHDVGLRDVPRAYSVATGVTAIKPADWNSDPQSWDADVTVWSENATGYQPPAVVFGTELRMLEVGASDDYVDGTTQPVVSYVERTGMDLGERYLNKTLTGCWPETIGGVSTMTMKFSAQSMSYRPIDMTGDLPFAANDPGQVDFFLDGFYVGFTLGSNSGPPWKYSGMRLAARRSGRASP